MDVQLVPEAEPITSTAVEAAIALAALAGPRRHPAYDAAWRHAALAESVERRPAPDDDER